MFNIFFLYNSLKQRKLRQNRENVNQERILDLENKNKIIFYLIFSH